MEDSNVGYDIESKFENLEEEEAEDNEDSNDEDTDEDERTDGDEPNPLDFGRSMTSQQGEVIFDTIRLRKRVRID